MFEVQEIWAKEFFVSQEVTLSITTRTSGARRRNRTYKPIVVVGLL